MRGVARGPTVVGMRRAGASLVLGPALLLFGAASAVAQTSDGSSDSGQRDAGESASTWGGIPFWVWILVVIAAIGLLVGFLVYQSRDRPSRPRSTAAPGAGDAAAPPRGPADTGPARDLAVAVYPHLSGADRAYAAAQVKDRDAPWLRETTFVESHPHGRIAVRGTFAGRYVDVDDSRHASPYGEIARAVVAAAFDDLQTALPEGSSALLVFGSAEALDRMAAGLDDEVVRRHLSDADARALISIASQAPRAAPSV